VSKASLETTADCLVVRGVLDFDSVVELASSGSRWLSQSAPNPCRLDLGGVSFSNSAGVALVLTWMRTAARAGRRLQVDNIPDSMVAMIRLGGLETVFK